MNLLILIISLLVGGSAGWIFYRRWWRQRPRTIVGVVQAGRGHGQAVGAATANLDVALAGSLAPGLYGCQVIFGREIFKGLLYYGHNQLTNAFCFEVHLLDFSGDMYGKQIVITTNKFIRRPKKFSSVEKLAAQIERDIAAARSR